MTVLAHALCHGWMLQGIPACELMCGGAPLRHTPTWHQPGRARTVKIGHIFHLGFN